MKEEVKRILKMVEEGKISSDKAAELIEALNKPALVENNAIVLNNLDKMLRVRVLDGEDTVNVNVPVKFLKAVGGAVKTIPGLKENGTDIDIKMIMDAIDAGLEGKIVDIKSSDGSIVEVVIE